MIPPVKDDQKAQSVVNAFLTAVVSMIQVHFALKLYPKKRQNSKSNILHPQISSHYYNVPSNFIIRLPASLFDYWRFQLLFIAQKSPQLKLFSILSSAIRNCMDKTILAGKKRSSGRRSGMLLVQAEENLCDCY